MGRVHVGLDFGGEPFVILLTEEGGDEAQEGGFVWEKSGDVGADLAQEATRFLSRAWAERRSGELKMERIFSATSWPISKRGT